MTFIPRRQSRSNLHRKKKAVRSAIQSKNECLVDAIPAVSDDNVPAAIPKSHASPTTRETSLPLPNALCTSKRQLSHKIVSEQASTKDDNRKPTKRPKRPKSYCPYSGCSFTENYGRRFVLYSHIRQFHDDCFPNVTHVRHKFVLSSGICIAFNETDRNSLNDGEKIQIKRVPKDEMLFYCPYQGCQYTCNNWKVYLHIQSSHCPSLPIRNTGKSVHEKYQLKRTGSDEPLDIKNEAMRDSVAPGEVLQLQIIPK